MPRLGYIVYVLLSVLFLATLATPVHSQRDRYRVEDELRRLSLDAQRAYDNLALDRAERALADAIRIIDRDGVNSRSEER